MILLLTIFLLNLKSLYSQLVFPPFVNCSTLSVSDCNNYDGCSSTVCQGTLNVSLLDLCSSYNRLESCEAAGCDWFGCVGNLQYPSSCSSLTDSISCNMANGCSWFNSQCSGSLEIPHSCYDFDSQSSCRIGLGCLWMGNICVGDFKGIRSCSQLSYYECPSNFGCKTSCSFNPVSFCGSVQNAYDCYSIGGCYWNGGFCTGALDMYQKTDCSVFSNVTCDDWPGCELSENKKCTNQSCSDIFEYDICIGKGCKWYFGLCVVPPTNFGK